MTKAKPRASTLAAPPGHPRTLRGAAGPEVTTHAIQRANTAYVQANMDDVLYEHGEEIIRALVSRALDGDVAAIKVCIDKVLPNASYRNTSLTLPPIQTSTDAVTALKNVVEEAAQGKIPLDSARVLSDMIERLRESLKQEYDISEWEKNVKLLQQIAAGESHNERPNTDPTD